ncbi:MAG: hypothetical protein ABI679_00500 [Gemmatimonadota bacterium]
MAHTSRVVVLLALLIACTGEGKPGTQVKNDAAASTQASRDSIARLAAGPAVHLEGANLDLARARVNNLAAGNSIEDVRTQLGSADGTEGPHQEQGGATTLVWIFPGIRITFSNRRITGITCSGARCMTPDSVRIGDSASRVQDTYGAAGVARLPDGSTIAYPFGNGHSCSLMFSFMQERVSAIALSCGVR